MNPFGLNISATNNAVAINGPSNAPINIGISPEQLDTIVELLNQELSIKNDQILFLQHQLQNQKPEIPKIAQELAEQIPSTADNYALALKAIAQERSDDAMVLLDCLQLNKESELADIYVTKGLAQYYQGKYVDAAQWYNKALALNPDDLDLLAWTGFMFLHAGNFKEAEPMLKSCLAIDEEILINAHIDVATSLNNLAALHRIQGELDKAEPLYKRSLHIREQNLDVNDPEIASSLNNLTLLYHQQEKFSEAELLCKRAIAIWEKNNDAISIANGLHNLAFLYHSQKKYNEAKPLYQRSLVTRICKQGKKHPSVAESLNNLAGLYDDQGYYSRANRLYKRSLAIYEHALGKGDHRTKNCAANLKTLQTKLPEKF